MEKNFEKLSIEEMSFVSGGDFLGFSGFEWYCAGMNMLAIASVGTGQFISAAGFVAAAAYEGCYRAPDRPFRYL